MKTLLLCLVLTLNANTTQAAPRGPIPDLPPDATSEMYLAIKGGNRLLTQANDGLDFIVSLGERNLKWLNHINSKRPAGQKLSLTSKETQRGIPIDKPSEYNPELIQKKHVDLLPKIPLEMKKVLFGGATFPDEPPVAIPDYLTASRELDRVFQSALRWRTMAPWLSYLEGRRHNDMRGFWYLSQLDARSSKLKRVKELSEPLRSKVRGWLIGLCYNVDRDSDTIAPCAEAVDSMINKGIDLEAYFMAEAPDAMKILNGYYNIPAFAKRPEVRWEEGSHPRVIAPFEDPGSDAVRAFLKDNIEDEWRFGNWHLEMPFSRSSDLPHVVFEPGVTPHVNGLGGDEITMNSSQPLTEYDAQWTIRHEYGHVLGFPDCYVEFYERERNVIVNYQFDVDNLMCSRKGHIKALHLEEMKRVYGR